MELTIRITRTEKNLILIGHDCLIVLRCDGQALVHVFFLNSKPVLPVGSDSMEDGDVVKRVTGDVILGVVCSPCITVLRVALLRWHSL